MAKEGKPTTNEKDQQNGCIDPSSVSALIALAYVRRFLAIGSTKPKIRLISQSDGPIWSDGVIVPLPTDIDEVAVLEQLEVALSAAGRSAATARGFSQALELRLRDVGEAGISLSAFSELAELAQTRRSITSGISPWLQTVLSRLLKRMPGMAASEDGRLVQAIDDPDTCFDMVPLFHFYPESFKASARWSRTEELLPGVGSLPVDEIYVELQIVEEAEFDKEHRENYNGSVDLAAMRRARRENLEVLSVPGEQLLHGRHRNIAIVGDPGSGKTTFLKWCSLKMLHESDGRWLLPLPISLREYALDALPGENIERFALRRLAAIEGEDASNLVKLLHYLSGTEKDTVIFLLDGWDEVPPDRRESLSGEIDTLSLAYSFILTSRRVGFPRGLPISETYAIVDLDVARVDDLVRRWYAWQEEDGGHGVDSEAAAEDLISRIDARPDLAELSRNPFLLTLLCLLHSRAQGQYALPDTRAEVYAQVIDHVRAEFNRRYPDRRFDDQALDSLSEFALYLFSDADKLPVQLFRRTHFNAFAESHDVADTMLDRIWKDSRLLSRWERVEETLHFVHLTFQEFLAARVLVHRNGGDVSKLLSKRGRETRWREVWRFYAGLKSGSGDGSGANQLLREVFERKDRYHYYLVETAMLIAETGARDGGESLVGEDIRPLLWDAWHSAWHPKPFVRAMALLDASWFVARAIREAEEPDGHDLQVMANLIRLIGRLGTEEAGRWLAEACIDEKNPSISAIAATAMASCVGKDGRRRLREWLASPPRGVIRIHAIRALGEARDFPSLDLLAAIVCDPTHANDMEAIQAAKAIGKIGGPGAREILLDILDREPEHPMRESAVDGIKNLQDRLTAQALLARLDPTMKPSLKMAMLDALSMMPIGAGASILNRFRKPEFEPDPQLRIRALHALAQVDHGNVPDWIIESIRSDPDPEVREAAMSALRERPRPTDYFFLADEALGDGPPDYRAGALDVICELAKRRASYPNSPELPDGCTRVARTILSRSHSGAEAISAARIAGHLGDRAVDALLGVLKDKGSDPLVVEETAWSLGRLRCQEALVYLARWWKKRKKQTETHPFERILSANLTGEDTILFDSSERAAMACAQAAAEIDPLSLLNDGSKAARNALSYWAGQHDASVFDDHIVLPTGEILGAPQKEEFDTQEESEATKIPEYATSHRLVVDIPRRSSFYRGVELKILPPRDWACLCVLAQHPGIALPLKTIYEIAVQQGFDAGRMDPKATNLPQPKVIRSAIRNAIRIAHDAQTETEENKALRKEIRNLLDSSHDGTCASSAEIGHLGVVLNVRAVEPGL